MDWTDKQKEFLDLNKQGKFVVKACPGSGKTTCVCERIFKLLQDWDKHNSGIAVLSFTNVAKNEILNKIEKEDKSLKLGYPHFFGTLDSFLNKFIFLPFGHLVMECYQRPELVGAPFNYWSGNNDFDYFFDKITFDSKGKVVDKKKTKYFPKENWKWNQIVHMKHELKREGLATQKDANYHAMEVLKQYPKIAKALTLRFPTVIIDEVQDTSEIQMKIMDILIQNGLKDIILVGDPEQGIYEWNTANPKLMEDKYNQWEDSIKFDINFRSSQKICNFFSNLSDLNNIKSNVSFNENFSPKIIPHNYNFEEIIINFINDCTDKGINISKDSVAVLFRSKDEPKKFKIKGNSFSINDIFRKDSFFKISYTRNIILANYYLYNGNYLKSFKEFEKAYIKLKYGEIRLIKEKIFQESFNKGFSHYRKEINNFSKRFPKINENQKIDEWILNINNNLNENENELNRITLKENNKFLNNLTFDNLFDEDYNDKNELDYYVGTIHSVKGESFDAVLLILKHGGFQDKHYKTHFQEDSNLMSSEELRIVYVGMSRARKLLHVAVPYDSKDCWDKKFLKKSYQSKLF
ncbi:Superfamily I DNA or RNA helicase [Methanobrevibacter olleyae]|uniref:DNA 3'-5' helicase n=1 Tax=Methanobrevibacter olleyae TaxID=294671 RepID=A0A1I4GFW1_METOL|nr:ATP-dependent helicase [Methanobrevibacter olleyae]SFL28934.1 Superfamily I DNA or RNA helicase [Methanobrevibacter olleyae]